MYNEHWTLKGDLSKEPGKIDYMEIIIVTSSLFKRSVSLPILSVPYLYSVLICIFFVEFIFLTLELGFSIPNT